MDYNSIVNRLGISRQEIANKLGISRTVVSLFLNGKYNGPESQRNKISNYIEELEKENNSSNKQSIPDIVLKSLSNIIIDNSQTIIKAIQLSLKNIKSFSDDEYPVLLEILIKLKNLNKIEKKK